MPEEVKAEAIHKTVAEMLRDMKYAQGMMEASVQNAKELHEVMKTYLAKTHMEEYVDAVYNLTDDEINSMSKEILNQRFPNHNLMAWDAVDVPEIDGAFDYPIEDYQSYLTNLRDRLHDYESLMKGIEESRQFVQKMSEIVYHTRVSQAKKVASSNSPDASKAQQFLDDLDSIHTCKEFFHFVDIQMRAILKADARYMVERYRQWVQKESTYESLLMNIREFCSSQGWVRYTDFLQKCMMSYIRFGYETTSRDVTMKNQTIYHLHLFFAGSPEVQDEHRQIIINKLNDMFMKYEEVNME